MIMIQCIYDKVLYLGKSKGSYFAEFIKNETIFRIFLHFSAL